MYDSPHAIALEERFDRYARKTGIPEKAAPWNDLILQWRGEWSGVVRAYGIDVKQGRHRTVGLAMGVRSDGGFLSLVQVEQGIKMWITAEPLLEKLMTVIIAGDRFRIEYLGEDAWNVGGGLWVEVVSDRIELWQRETTSGSRLVRSCPRSMGGPLFCLGNLFGLGRRAKTNVTCSRTDGPNWPVLLCVMVHLRMWVLGGDD